ERGNAPLNVEANFQKAGAHFETRIPAGDLPDAASESLGRGCVIAPSAGAALLQDFYIEVDAAAARGVDNREQFALFLLEILFGIDAAVCRDRARAGHYIEAAAGLRLPAEHEDRFAGSGGGDLKLRFVPLHFCLQL